MGPCFQAVLLLAGRAAFVSQAAVIVVVIVLVIIITVRGEMEPSPSLNTPSGMAARP